MFTFNRSLGLKLSEYKIYDSNFLIKKLKQKIAFWFYTYFKFLTCDFILRTC